MARIGETRVYRRKLSRDDAETSRVLDERRRAMCPAPMCGFTIYSGGARFMTRIVAGDRARVPPAHQHYCLEAMHGRDRLMFGAGRIIEIECTGDAHIMRNG